MDEGSSSRADRAMELARHMGVQITRERRSAHLLRRRGESIEEAARRIRYGFLEETADTLNASYIATAHQANDQVETVLLRLIFGSGLAGLAGIPARRGRVIRPLLDIDRQAIGDYLAEHRLAAVTDPTNDELATPRNRIRHILLPQLRASDDSIDDRLSALARTARSSVASLDRRLASMLSLSQDGAAVSCDLERLRALPAPLREHAVGSLCRKGGASPPSRAALGELEHQLRIGANMGCDLGGGWRLVEASDRVRLQRATATVGPFAYTLCVPGEIHLEEISQVLRLSRQSVEPWMFRGSRRRAGLMLPISDGDEVTIRNRRPGDRLQPFGCGYSRRLKDVLIDRKIPHQKRDELPLLCVDGNIVWVPGVTIDDSVRLREASNVWVAELEPTQESNK